MTKRMRFYVNVFSSLCLSFLLNLYLTPGEIVEYKTLLFFAAMIIFIYEAFNRPEDKRKKVKKD